MILIEEITRENMCEYWTFHWEYLNQDIFGKETSFNPYSLEDRDHFKNIEYRGTIEKHMDRKTDTAHAIYFVRNNIRIGCALYITYKSEDGKCFLLDYWVFPQYRGNGTGYKCFDAFCGYVELDGAKYYQINVSNERNRNFWKSLGFDDDGVDNYKNPLMKRIVTIM